MSDLLNIGRTGLNASKKSLETTGHNISNANTEGYSRQKVNQTTNVPITKSGLVHGTGVRLKSVTRVHDPYVEKRLAASITDNHFFQNRFEQLTQVEDIFNEVDTDGLNKMMNKFFNSFRELANQPENETIRSVVRDQASLVIKDFRRIRETLDTISHSVDQRFQKDVVDINQILDHTAELNKKIATLEAVHEETGDLRDQRDLALKTLSESFKLRTYVDDQGSYVVSAEGVGTLVTGTQVQYLSVGNIKDQNASEDLGGLDIYFQGKSSRPLTNRFKGGKLAALAKIRNVDVQNLREKMDSLAYDFTKTVNAVHRRGFVNRQVQTNEAGEALGADNKGPITGINFFKEPTDKLDASLNIDMSSAVKKDLTNIATALAVNSPGDNRIAIAISKLQHERISDDGQATLEENFLKTIGNLGIETGKAKLDAEQSEGLLAQAVNLRERLSGVSIDEETANMVKFQHAYEASAKIMQTADDMFKTVINIKR